jgi:N-acetylglutamate synthase
VSHLSPADVGARVTVRYQLPDGTATDVVGELQPADGDVLAIRRRTGEIVRVATSDVVVAKVIGHSLRAARELEEVSARGWPPIESTWLGRWWLGASAGFTSRANSVRPLGSPGVPLDDALAFAGSWYAQRGLPTRIRLVRGASLDRELRRRGWSAGFETSVQTVTVARATSRLEELGADPAGVEVRDAPSSDWLRLFRGGEVPPAALSVLTGCPLTAFATVTDGDGTLAIGRGSVDQAWTGLTAIEVARRGRRRGYAKAVVAALLSWAGEQGATRVYLEVLRTNAPAIALYQSLGFAEQHRYLYREPAS